MKQKTILNAEDDHHDIVITREFDLPVDLLFKAHIDPDIVGEWMGTNVIKFEGKKHGSWRFQTSDTEGNVLFEADGVFHDVITDEKIVRTFEMSNAPFGPQLEFLEFNRIGEDRSMLKMHIVYRSVEVRDQMLKLPFAQGLNMAHNRLQEYVSQLK